MKILDLPRTNAENHGRKAVDECWQKSRKEKPQHHACKGVVRGLPKRLTLLLIRFYQLFFSPDHSWLKARYPYGFCRYYPSCSEYAKKSIIKNGVALGLLKSFYRVIRCNPLFRGGIDLP